MSAPDTQEFVLPRTARELIAMLDRAFPLQNFPVDMSLHAINRELGKRDVIDFLRRLEEDDQ